MANQTTVTMPDLDSTELFQAAMADEPKPEVDPVAESKPEQTEDRPRDEQGRFVPKAEAEAKPVEAAKPEQVQAAKPEAQPQPEAKDDQGQVPSWRLREVREAREAAERRAIEADQQRYALQQELQSMRQEMAQLRKPATEPVDFFQNPEEAFQQRLSPIEERFAAFETRMRLNSSRAVAIATHGIEAVNEMDQSIAKAMREGNPEMHTLRAQLQASDDPVGLAIQWHKRTKLWETTGGDPDKYRQKILDDAMKDPKFQAQVLETARTAAGGGQNGSRSPVVQLPPSLNRASGTAGNQSEALGEADMSDNSLFRHARDSARR